MNNLLGVTPFEDVAQPSVNVGRDNDQIDSKRLCYRRTME